MKLVEMKCNNCGATLEVEEGTKEVTCKYCKATFAIDDEVQHVQHDNMYESGYEFEKGRMQAQEDKEQEEAEEAMKNQSPITNALVVGLILFMALAGIGIIIALFTSESNNNASKKINRVNVSYYDYKKEYDEKIAQMDEERAEREAESNKKSFNSQFEYYSGTKDQIIVNALLERAVTNNKTNKDQIITVVYKDNTTTDPDQIIKIKQSLKKFTEYEAILDYDENGYVNKITIEDIKR